MKAHRWGVGEITLKSSKNYNDPVRDVDLGVVFVVEMEQVDTPDSISAHADFRCLIDAPYFAAAVC